MKSKVRDIELLAPARNADIAIEAIKHGADAVYLGPSSFGARAMAGNSTADIARVADFAHQFGARVYATVNTIVYDHELPQVEALIGDLYRAGVDALIVQDMGILRLDLPPIALHASTQCDLRTPAKARFLESLGFSQLVMARELTLQEISDIHAAVKVPLEAFVHGALCVSYSGRCQASQCLKGRSANRGECAQVCRLAYDLEDAAGHKLVQGKHLLSLRDFNAQPELSQMLASGVSSLKIEGRLKDMSYVKNVVAYYRQELDKIINVHPDQYRRSSAGTSSYTFTPDVSRSFNRSFTSYFLQERRPANGHTMASIDTPKSMGQPLGKIIHAHGKQLRIATQVPLHNGDGISYLDARGEYCGVRVNRVEGHDIYLKDAVAVPRGAMAYRTLDKALDDVLAKPSAERRIAVDARLWWTGGKLCLELSDERGNRVVHSVPLPSLDAANSPQGERQQAVLSKLGNTIYSLNHCTVLPGKFIPSSLLTRLRRETVALLDRAHKATLSRPVRRPEDRDAQCYTTILTYADNVANHLAAQLYRDHGVTQIEPALEVKQPERDVPVMHTRYCLRRELGACRRDPKAARQLPDPLYLHSGTTRLRVECDCQHCEMRLFLG